MYYHFTITNHFFASSGYFCSSSFFSFFSFSFSFLSSSSFNFFSFSFLSFEYILSSFFYSSIIHRHTSRPITTIIKTAINKIIKMGHSNPPILTANSYPNYLVFFSDLVYVKFNFCESVGRLKNLEIKLRVLVSCDIVGLLAA